MHYLIIQNYILLHPIPLLPMMYLLIILLQIIPYLIPHHITQNSLLMCHTFLQIIYLPIL
jgi:hypothetical protein